MDSLRAAQVERLRRPIEFTVSLEEFDRSRLPAEAQQPGSDAFAAAVVGFYDDQFAEAGGRVVVEVADTEIRVKWIPKEGANLLDYAVRLLSAGDYNAGVPLLESLNKTDPDSAAVLFNLGMAYSDLGRLDEARAHLERAVRSDPEFASAWVALGVAQARSRRTDEALASLRTALDLEPDNPYAERNLAAALANAGSLEEAEKHFRKAATLAPKDQAAALGLAQCVEQRDRFDEADGLYATAIRIDSDSPLAEVARQARSAIAHRGFRSKTVGGLRPDATMYCLAAIEEFERLSPSDLQAIVFEIALLGRGGLDVNDPTRKYTLNSLPGRSLTGLQLVSMMYVGFKGIDPSADVGFDLSTEYEQALALHKSKQP
jgi:tetratricopeptide (TPR) repeat protein